MVPIRSAGDGVDDWSHRQDKRVFRCLDNADTVCSSRSSVTDLNAQPVLERVSYGPAGHLALQNIGGAA
jgi:hypothetical protein